MTPAIHQLVAPLVPVRTAPRLRCHFALCALALAFCISSLRAQVAPTPTPDDELGAEVTRFVEADRMATPAPCQVLFVGSSSIVKWKDTLATDMAPMPVINRGFGGSHIEHVNRWFDQVVSPYQPRAIVFYAGENDLDAGKSVEKVLADFDEFMRRKTQALGDTPVYFISLKPSKERFAEFSLQGRVNEAVRQRAGQRSDLHYIDIVPAMLDEQGKPKDLFVSDGLHMNAAGYEIWTRAVRAAILPDVEAAGRSCQSRISSPSARKPSRQ